MRYASGISVSEDRAHLLVVGVIMLLYGEFASGVKMCQVGNVVDSDCSYTGDVVVRKNEVAISHAPGVHNRLPSIDCISGVKS